MIAWRGLGRFSEERKRVVAGQGIKAGKSWLSYWAGQFMLYAGPGQFVTAASTIESIVCTVYSLRVVYIEVQGVCTHRCTMYILRGAVLFMSVLQSAGALLVLQSA
jgi:hypothetical protein